ncbi:hypothetical protein ACODQQ_02390, partial [Enterobacter quasiroggenkampii]|uniref:hypothetical protein n=1 Tax=Enterobacter quasiroggenkampii TaxID=2497436 RepID=UPI003B007E7A
MSTLELRRKRTFFRVKNQLSRAGCGRKGIRPHRRLIRPAALRLHGPTGFVGRVSAAPRGNKGGYTIVSGGHQLLSRAATDWIFQTPSSLTMQS